MAKRPASPPLRTDPSCASGPVCHHLHPVIPESPSDEAAPPPVSCPCSEPKRQQMLTCKRSGAEMPPLGKGFSPGAEGCKAWKKGRHHHHHLHASRTSVPALPLRTSNSGHCAPGEWGGSMRASFHLNHLEGDASARLAFFTDDGLHKH